MSNSATSLTQETPLAQLTQIRQIKRWFESTVPDPDNRNVHTQIGVHLEEVSEMMSALRDAGS